MMTEVVSTGVTISRTEAHEQLGPLPRVTGDYLLKKITLTGDSGFQSRGTPSIDGGEPISVTTISIPQLYELVKTYDKNFFEIEQGITEHQFINGKPFDIGQWGLFN